MAPVRWRELEGEGALRFLVSAPDGRALAIELPGGDIDLAAGEARLGIYDAGGRLVRRLAPSRSGPPKR